MPNVRVSAKFLTAKSKEALQLALLTYQLQRSKVVNIVSGPMPDPQGGWTVWFYDELDLPNISDVIKKVSAK